MNDQERNSLWSRWFVGGLLFILTGYALFGRGFAYLGFSPLFVGEIVMGIGLVAMLTSGKLKELVRTPIVIVLILFLLWSALMAIPYLSVHGINTLRDSVIWGYAVFALAVASVVLSRPQLFRSFLLRYRSFVYVFAASAWLIFTISRLGLLNNITLPGSSEHLFDSKGGDLLVHLAGVSAFVAVGMTRHRLILVPMLLLNFGILVISKRAGMLACFAAFALLLILKPPKLKISLLAYTGFLAVVAVALFNPRVDLGGGRIISMEQFTTNLKSTFDSSSAHNLETTKSWRLDWWGDIVGYTFGGPYFLTGKGYGVNLANSDGYQVLEDESLRSPHNGHMTVLARSGVPGFLLWVSFHALWFFSVLKSCLRARRRGEAEWHGIFAFLLAYWVAFQVNASFDVFLEGPMGGIWFWSLIGFGLAAVELYRRSPEIAHDQLTFMIDTPEET